MLSQSCTRPWTLDGILGIFLLLLVCCLAFCLFVFPLCCSWSDRIALDLSLEPCETPGCLQPLAWEGVEAWMQTASSFLHCSPQSIQQPECKWKSLVLKFILVLVVLSLHPATACAALTCFPYTTDPCLYNSLVSCAHSKLKTLYWMLSLLLKQFHQTWLCRGDSLPLHLLSHCSGAS